MDPETTRLTLQLVLDRCTREALLTKSSWDPPKTDKGNYLNTISPKLAVKIALAKKVYSLHAKGKLLANFEISWLYDNVDSFFEAQDKLDSSKVGAFENCRDDLQKFLLRQLSSLMNVNDPEVGD